MTQTRAITRWRARGERCIQGVRADKGRAAALGHAFSPTTMPSKRRRGTKGARFEHGMFKRLRRFLRRANAAPSTARGSLRASDFTGEGDASRERRAAKYLANDSRDRVAAANNGNAPRCPGKLPREEATAAPEKFAGELASPRGTTCLSKPSRRELLNPSSSPRPLRPELSASRIDLEKSSADSSDVRSDGHPRALSNLAPLPRASSTLERSSPS